VVQLFGCVPGRGPVSTSCYRRANGPRAGRLLLLGGLRSSLVLGGVALVVAFMVLPAGAQSSRDGLLAFTRVTDDPASQEGDPHLAIYVANTDGSGVRRLTSPCCAYDPVWSPDGSKIAYQDGVSGTIFVMRADGGGKHLLCPRSCLKSVAWPTDPLANGSSPSDCYCMDDPTWSPDGERVAFVTQSGHLANVAVMSVRLDGSGLRVLFRRRLNVGSTEGGSSLAWSPDGARFAFR
jgi:Tol biopolymer transport system component